MKAMRFLLKGLAIAIGTVVILAAASFAVSNRAMVAISLWPLPFETAQPLGTVLLSTLAVGMVLGAALMTLSRLRLYFRARRNERKAAELERSVAHRAMAEPERPASPNTALPSPAARAALSDN